MSVSSRLSTAAPSPQHPVPAFVGSPADTPHWTADYLSTMQQMQLMLSTLEARLTAMENGQRIATAGLASPLSAPPTAAPTPKPTSKPPTARTSRRSSRHPTPSTTPSLPQARDLPPTQGTSVPRYECVLELPDALVSHVVGRQGKGLKQTHDLSGSRLTAFTLDVSGSVGDRRFVTIRGTDSQIGDALVVIGKRIAKKRVRVPRKKHGENASQEPAPPPPSGVSASSTPVPSTSGILPFPSARTPSTPSTTRQGQPSPSVPATQSSSTTATPRGRSTHSIRFAEGGPSTRGTNSARRSRPFPSR